MGQQAPPSTLQATQQQAPRFVFPFARLPARHPRRQHAPAAPGRRRSLWWPARSHWQTSADVRQRGAGPHTAPSRRFRLVRPPAAGASSPAALQAPGAAAVRAVRRRPPVRSCSPASHVHGGALLPSPGAGVGGVSQVPVPMWEGRAQSRCRCGRGEPSPGADRCGSCEPSPSPAVPHLTCTGARACVVLAAAAHFRGRCAIDSPPVRPPVSTHMGSPLGYCCFL
jgi:hypothetical protein